MTLSYEITNQSCSVIRSPRAPHNCPHLQNGDLPSGFFDEILYLTSYLKISNIKIKFGRNFILCKISFPPNKKSFNPQIPTINSAASIYHDVGYLADISVANYWSLTQ